MVNAFEIDAVEVSNDAYRRCVAAGRCPGLEDRPEIDSFAGTYPTVTGRFTDPRYGSLPVLGLTVNDAPTYCAWVGGRLPTWDEWWKAHLGGCEIQGSAGCDDDVSPTALSFDDASHCLDINAGFRCDRPDELDFCTCNPGSVSVGTSPADVSPYGVLDMIGNAWELVSIDERRCGLGSGSWSGVGGSSAWPTGAYHPPGRCMASPDAINGFRCAYDR